MAGLDAHRAYDVWLRLIADEELCEATLAGRHAELAAARGLEAEDLAILDEFAARPGTRWNVENLRFRAADEVKTKLKIWLPRTVWLLTAGNDDWLQDICYEYLAHHRWQEHGHFQLAEAQRFAAYVRDRIMKRRRTPPELEPVLTFEAAVAALVQSTQALVPDSWPAPPSGPLDGCRLRRGPAVTMVELPLDITEWIRTGDPSRGHARGGAVTILLFIPSAHEKWRIQVLGEGARAVFERCHGERTPGEIADELERELGLDPEETSRLLRRWLEQGALVAA